MTGKSRPGVGSKVPPPRNLATLFILLLPLIMFPEAYGAEYFMETSDKEILDFLVHKSRYDKRIIPPSDGPLRVNVSVLLLSLSSPDESSLKYEVEFLLHQNWLDPRLQHNDTDKYPYLSGMHHLMDVWLPDTYFIKHGEFKEPLMPDNIALKIFQNGTIAYTRRRHIILSCEGDLQIFPFDDPFCTFAMESASHEKKDLIFYWRDIQARDSLATSHHLRALNAYIIYNRTTECDETFSWRGNFSCLRVDLKFTRDDAFYFSTVFVPGIILVTSSFITFWLEWNAVPARVMIGVTTMLNFFTTSNSFRSTLPVVSNLSAMNLWDSVCMFFIYVSLLEFVVVNYVGRKRPKHNMVYIPGENAVIQVLSENKSTERKGSEEATGTSPEPSATNRNSHELTCANCGNPQCSHSNAPNNCSTGENVSRTEQVESVSQVEYTFKRQRKDPPHPIRVAKSIDVISRIVFPLSYSIFLLYFFAKYKGFN